MINAVNFRNGNGASIRGSGDPLIVWGEFTVYIISIAIAIIGIRCAGA